MIHRSDYLVIGSGIAGLSFALRAANHGRVILITKKAKADTNTNRAQGGIASVFGKDDSFDLHIEDTLTSGVGLCNRKAVEIIVRDAPERIRELMDWGVGFTGNEEAGLDLGREGGHSRNRIVHAQDKTGMAVESALLAKVKAHPQIQVFDKTMVAELITEHHLVHKPEKKSQDIHCWGAYAYRGDTREVDAFLANVTLLCTGGVGRVYLHTTNPEIATGDGIAMAFRAGAKIANMEFMQFHPTSLYHPDGDCFLISEAVRGDGAVLRNRAGDRFMTKYHPLADLAPRDIVARAIDSEMKFSGEPSVFLDATLHSEPELLDRFPQIFERLKELKINMQKEWISVVPAAHYMCGGVLSDLYGRSSIKGLYVTGEVACTGVHGANRLASNSLLEALVFSHRAYEDALAYLNSNPDAIPDIPPWNDEGTFDQEEWVLISHDLVEVQRLMWDYVGIVRSNERLERAQRRVGLIAEEVERFFKKTRITPPLLELRNLCSVAELIIRSALFRKESRGLHYTTDYPDRDDQTWMGNTVIQKKQIALEAIE